MFIDVVLIGPHSLTIRALAAAMAGYAQEIRMVDTNNPRLEEILLVPVQ